MVRRRVRAVSGRRAILGGFVWEDDGEGREEGGR